MPGLWFSCGRGLRFPGIGPGASKSASSGALLRRVSALVIWKQLADYEILLRPILPIWRVNHNWRLNSPNHGLYLMGLGLQLEKYLKKGAGWSSHNRPDPMGHLSLLSGLLAGSHYCECAFNLLYVDLGCQSARLAGACARPLEWDRVRCARCAHGPPNTGGANVLGRSPRRLMPTFSRPTRGSIIWARVLTGDGC